MNMLPKNEADLQAMLGRIEQHLRRNQVTEALCICDALIEHATTRVAGHRARADVRLAMGQTTLAADDLNAVVNLDPREPADFHALGIVYLKLGKPRDAADAFASAIDVGERDGFRYYTNSARFHRAEALRRAGLMKEAKADARHLPDGYECFIAPDGVRSKEQLLERLDREAPSQRGR